MEVRCSVCDCSKSETRRMIKGMCEKCYQRVKASPKVYPLPAYGEVAYSPDGKPVCHVCGRAYKKILSHAWQQHQLSHKEYKKEFGLCFNRGIMSEESTNLARKRNKENYDKVVIENLIERGERTRFYEGHELTVGRYFCEQNRRIFLKNRHVPGK